MRPKYTKDALATLEVTPFFFWGSCSIWELKTSPRNFIWRKIKLLPTADEKPHSLGTRRETRKTEWPPFPTILCQGAPSFRNRFSQKEVYLDTSDGFGLRSPVIQKPFQPKRGIP